jgi:hypothetical protein
MSARDAILAAFDELFDAAAAKLAVSVTPEERAEARAHFSERFEKALEMAGTVEMKALPRPVLDEMKAAVIACRWRSWRASWRRSRSPRRRTR